MDTYVLETLNTWGGRLYDPLSHHIENQSKEVDIFCFQETFKTSSNRTHTRGIEVLPESTTINNDYRARASFYIDLQKILQDYNGIFYSVQDRMDYKGKTPYNLEFGQATFLKKTLPVVKSGETFVYREKNSYEEGDWLTVGRNIVYTQTLLNNKNFLICNFHGVHGNGKIDTPDRIEQAEKVKAFLDRFDAPKILCGDFNLLPNTESMVIMEKGMRNLVKEFGIASTRSYFYEKEARFADYILVSEDVEVKDFRVLDEVVSDHLPLQLEFA